MFELRTNDIYTQAKARDNIDQMRYKLCIPHTKRKRNSTKSNCYEVDTMLFLNALLGPTCLHHFPRVNCDKLFFQDKTNNKFQSFLKTKCSPGFSRKTSGIVTQWKQGAAGCSRGEHGNRINDVCSSVRPSHLYYVITYWPKCLDRLRFGALFLDTFHLIAEIGRSLPLYFLSNRWYWALSSSIFSPNC